MTQTPPLSVSQAAKIKEVPKRTLQYAIAKGHLAAHKLPGATGAYLIYPADLDQWAAQRQVDAS